MQSLFPKGKYGEKVLRFAGWQVDEVSVFLELAPDLVDAVSRKIASDSHERQEVSQRLFEASRMVEEASQTMDEASHSA